MRIDAGLLATNLFHNSLLSDVINNIFGRLLMVSTWMDGTHRQSDQGENRMGTAPMIGVFAQCSRERTRDNLFQGGKGGGCEGQTHPDQ